MATFGKPISFWTLSHGWAVALVMLVVFAPAIAQQYTFRGYGQPEGLGNLSVTCLVEDHSGFLWICTENGLYRHDGREFQRFGESDGLRDTTIHSIVVDPAGRLWVGTSHDVYLFDGQRFSAVRPHGHALSVAFGARLANARDNHLLAIDKETLLELFPAADGRTWDARPYFDERQLQATPALAHLTSLYADSKGRVWLGCGVQICEVQNGRVISWGEAEGAPEDEWRSWTLDAQQRL